MFGGPAGMLQSRLKFGSTPAIHFTPGPLTSSVRKTVDVEPVVDATVERSCAVAGRPTPVGMDATLTSVPLTPIENPRPGEVAVLGHSAKPVGTFGNTRLKW